MAVDKDEIKRAHNAQAHDMSKDDMAGMMAVGKEPVFVRKFNFWTVLGISICVSGTWEGITAAVAQAFYAGGPVAFIYGYILASIMGVILCFCLAELASAYPTSGAVYHWTASLCPPRYRTIVGWVTGCTLAGGGWLGLTSTAYGVALQIQAYVILSVPSYEPERWHATLIVYLVLLITLASNIFARRVLKYVNIAVMVVHVVGYFAIMITLLVCTKDKHTPEYVFEYHINYTGWQNNGIAWCIGLLSSVYGFIGLETASYFCEETMHASTSIPKAMVWCVTTNAVMTFPFIIVYLFCLGDLDAVLASPIGQTTPTTQIYVNATGSVAAGIFMNSMATFVAFASCTDIVGSGSRAVFAMARDGLFPAVFAVVSPKYDVPILALFFVSLPAFLLSLIYIGNTTAFYGFMSGVLVVFMVQYCAVLCLALYQKLKKSFFPGPWNLGKFSVILNSIAVAWTLFLTIILCFPTVIPVTAENMNYASAMLGVILVLTTAYWFSWHHKSHYEGPVVEIDAENFLN